MITSCKPEENITSDSQTTTSGNSAALSDLAFILDDTADIISCLYYLSIAMRQPAPQDRLKKYATIELSHFREFDEKHVREKFPSAEPFLI